MPTALIKGSHPIELIKETYSFCEPSLNVKVGIKSSLGVSTQRRNFMPTALMKGFHPIWANVTHLVSPV